MQIRTIQTINVFCYETQTSLRDIPQYVRVIAQRLYIDAIKNNLEITGPVYWIYKGADGQPDTKFELTIALPVFQNTATITNSEFKLKTLDTFRCVSRTHSGDWAKLGETYGSIFSEILVKEPALSGENREIYLNMDFANSEGNITEVQIGLV
ncbi:GyrI-like domain-containing protein [Dyadobacter sp. CY312]|uniref:GyrI-like domain-containing protein n=1 Tax=Dyadobacter sp. CY312 TaxID=2907303 RepID=UPI001F3B8129|nr:GyrI-like domain-containing protein [Dyadobacter sp. CY312]MCE7043055.1 GyrI-like domain-containing protein [Dyadobacter sp. CY312]